MTLFAMRGVQFRPGPALDATYVFRARTIRSGRFTFTLSLCTFSSNFEGGNASQYWRCSSSATRVNVAPRSLLQSSSKYPPPLCSANRLRPGSGGSGFDFEREGRRIHVLARCPHERRRSAVSARPMV